MENYDYLCSGITVEDVVDSMVSFSITKNLSKNFCFSIFICIFALPNYGRVAELVDASDLKSEVQKWAWGFDSPLGHSFQW